MPNQSLTDQHPVEGVSMDLWKAMQMERGLLVERPALDSVEELVRAVSRFCELGSGEGRLCSRLSASSDGTGR
jgi:hypothetical protein